MQITCMRKQFVKTSKIIMDILGEYQDLYLKSDTLLLAKFSKTSEKCV